MSSPFFYAIENNHLDLFSKNAKLFLQIFLPTGDLYIEGLQNHVVLETEMEEIHTLVARAIKCKNNLEQRHEAFGEIVRHFQDMAYGCAYAVLDNSQLAQDAAQEAFLAAYRDLDKLKDANAFAGWIFTMEANTSGRHYIWRRFRDTRWWPNSFSNAGRISTFGLDLMATRHCTKHQ